MELRNDRIMTVWLIAALGVCIGLTAGLLGAGSSVLTVLLLVHVAGLPIGTAVTTSLVVVAATSVAGLLHYSRTGDVMWKTGAGFSVTSMSGAFLGGRLSVGIPARVLLATFAMATVVAAVAMFRGSRPAAMPGARRSRLSFLAVAGAGVPLGGFTGLVGLGGGFAVLPLLVLLGGTPVRAAVGTTLLVVVMNTMAGLAGRLPHPVVDWRLAGYLAVAASIGSVLGAKVSERIDASVLRRIFAAVMLAIAVVLLGRAVAG
jgi:uncharacterized membrane protein YfcA